MDILVTNLATKATKADLLSLFEAYGEVTTFRIPMDFRTNRHNGMAFITMTDDEAARNAMKELNGQKIHDKAIVVAVAPVAMPPRKQFNRSTPNKV